MRALSWLRGFRLQPVPPEPFRRAARCGVLASLLLLTLLAGPVPEAAAQSPGISVTFFGLEFRTGIARRVLEGRSVDLSVVLKSQPTGDVTVTVTGHAGTDLGVDTDSNTPGDQAALTFTPSDWDVRQKVTVRAVEDDDENDEATVHLVFTASGADYGGQTSAYSLSVDDDDPVDASGYFPDYTYRLNFDQSTYVAAEDEGFLLVGMQLSRALPEDIVLEFRYDHLTTDRLDYAPVTRLRVRAGDANPTLRIPISNDKGVEENELSRIYLVKGPKYDTTHTAIVQTDLIIQDPDYWSLETGGVFACFGGRLSTDPELTPTVVTDPDGGTVAIPHRGRQLFHTPEGIDVSWEEASYRAGDRPRIRIRTTDGKRACTNVHVYLAVASNTADEVARNSRYFTSGSDDHPLPGGLPYAHISSGEC